VLLPLRTDTRKNVESVIELDFSRCRPVMTPDGWSGVKEHVKEGVRALVTHPAFFLADEMGAMKSAQVIIAAQFLFEANVIDRVVVVAPASVRPLVWYDPELGELARHLWNDIPATIIEWHSQCRVWRHGPATPEGGRRLEFIATNYEFIRPIARRQGVVKRDPEANLKELLPYCGPRTLLALDESSAVKNAQSKQTKACMKLRKACGRVVLLNGTPISNGPGDMFSQGNLLTPKILECPSYTQFRARYAIMKPVLGAGGKAIRSPRGFVIQQEVGWTGIEDIQRRFAPYVLRRLKKDCLDLPEKLPSVALTKTLEPKTWATYKEMRDELVVWLSAASVSQAPQAVTKVMRLAQITSGFLGGVEEIRLSNDAFPEIDDAPDYIKALTAPLPESEPLRVRTGGGPIEEIGREKQDAFLEWLDEALCEDQNFKVVVRSCFRFEMLRLEQELRRLYPKMAVGLIIGGQKKQDREAALRLLDPRIAPEGPVVIIMSVAAGALGINLTAASTMFTLSNSFSLKDRLQSDDRIHRPGQRRACSYYDLIATGPQGQKTINHHTLARLMDKQDLANLTTSGWLDMIRHEIND
jgi:hypothetical protein